MQRAKLILAALLIAGLAMGAYVLVQQRTIAADRPMATVDAYVRATYARDFATAYNYLSASDRQVRDRKSFVDSQHPYSGFTLEVASKLASFIEMWLVDRQERSGRIVIKVGYRVPAPAELNDLLLNWDQDLLNGLAKEKQADLLAELDARKKAGKLLNIEGQETIELTEERAGWMVFLDWAAGTRVLLQSKIADGNNLEVRFATTEVMAQNDELFLVNVTIKNPGQRAVTFAVSHLFEPPEVADDLQLVECGLLTPTTLEAKQEKEFAMAYQLNSAAGQALHQVKLTYEFKLQKR